MQHMPHGVRPHGPTQGAPSPRGLWLGLGLAMLPQAALSSWDPGRWDERGPNVTMRGLWSVLGLGTQGGDRTPAAIPLMLTRFSFAQLRTCKERGEG